jgi:type I pantothenate kinase
MDDAVDPAIEALATWLEPRIDRAPFLVGIAGSVAVGKSRVAAELVAVLARSRTVDLVTTDGFLFPNDELAALGLEARKGFPESYDGPRLERFLRDVRSGAAEVAAPVYSHVAYDVLPDEVHVVRRPDVLVVEGVNVLQEGPAALLDLRVYVDAEEAHILRWYTERFLLLRAAAVEDETSFFRRFTGGEDPDAEVLAGMIWRGINGVNLSEHILPTRDQADVVLVKGADHRITELRLPD